MNDIKTRFIILSDTHGAEFGSDWRKPGIAADVAIHCGDLTEESKLGEFEATIRVLKDIDAPLKLCIAGNHDLTLDIAAFERKVAELKRIQPEDGLQSLIDREYGTQGKARKIIEEARDAGIVYLEEGVYEFSLENGAQLVVYACPFTLGDGGWAFEYSASDGYNFAIPNGVHVIVTHGPPRGLMDYTTTRSRIGCPDLFAAVARARPRLHCFGHVHSGWGAKKVTWRELSDRPSHFTDIDNEKSTAVKSLLSFKRGKYDTDEIWAEKEADLQSCLAHRYCRTSHCGHDEDPLVAGKQTLFVNAAIEDAMGNPTQFPWIVELDLPSQI